MTSIAICNTGCIDYTPNVRPGRHRLTRPRTLNLLDLENLLGGRVETDAVRDAWSEFVAVADLRHDDHSCVAVSRQHAAAAFFSLPGNVQRIVGSNGPDGADLALLDAIDYRWATANFGQVIIASGDHVFVPVANRFREAGLPVVQVIGSGRSSAALYHASTKHKYLPKTRRAASERLRMSAA